MGQPSWWRTSWITQLYVDVKGTISTILSQLLCWNQTLSSAMYQEQYRLPVMYSTINCNWLCNAPKLSYCKFLYEFLYLLAAQNSQNQQKFFLAIKSAIRYYHVQLQWYNYICDHIHIRGYTNIWSWFALWLWRGTVSFVSELY